MSDDKRSNSTNRTHYLELPSTVATRREMLQLLGAFGAVGMLAPATARASSPAWTVIPHGEVIELALTDPAYRAKLLDKPKLTLAQEHGLTFAPDVKVIVVQDSLAKIHVVLSSEPGMRGAELGVVGEILTAYRTKPAFRQLILSNPKAAFEAWTGAVVPDSLNVVPIQETVLVRVIQLPAPGTLHLESLAEVRAVWGEAEAEAEEDGWWGGPPPEDPKPETITITSGQACNCWSLGSDYESQASNCCFDDDDLETETGIG